MELLKILKMQIYHIINIIFNSKYADTFLNFTTYLLYCLLVEFIFVLLISFV